MYSQILKYLFRKVREDHDRAAIAMSFRNIVGCIITLAEPLSVPVLARLLGIRESEVRFRLHHLHSILDIPEDLSLPIRLFHLSFGDFLLDSRRCSNRDFHVEAKKVHEMLARRCLRLMSCLKTDICNLSHPGTLVNDIDPNHLSEHIPAELQYACRYWIEHLLKSELKLHDDDEIHSFMRQHLLHWLEALSLMRKASESILAIVSLESAVIVSDHDSVLGEILTNKYRLIKVLGCTRSFMMRNDSRSITDR
jgi:hypothetical protein